MANTLLVVVKHNGVIADGKLTQHTITNQGLYVPAEGGIADFGLQVQALCVLPQFQRLANGQQAFVVARKDLHPICALGDCLRESARLDDVPAAVDVGEHSAIAGENTLGLVVVLQLEFNGFLLSLPTSVLHALHQGAFPGASPHALGIVRRRYPQIVDCELRRHCGVIVGHVGLLGRRPVSGLRIHPGYKVIQGEILCGKINSKGFQRLCRIILGKFHLLTAPYRSYVK